jgi:hypothetical protein
MRAAVAILAGTLFLTANFGCEKDADGSLIPIEAYSGNWLCREVVGEFAPQTYMILIEPVAGTSNDDVVIKGLYNLGPDFILIGRVEGRRLVIPQQEANGKQFSGEGLANARYTQVELVFSAVEGGITDAVQALLIK